MIQDARLVDILVIFSNIYIKIKSISIKMVKSNFAAIENYIHYFISLYYALFCKVASFRAAPRWARRRSP